MKIYNSFSKETGLEWTPASNHATIGALKSRILHAAMIPGSRPDPALVDPLPGNQNQPKPTKIHFLNLVGLGWFKSVLVGLSYQLAKKAGKIPSCFNSPARLSQLKPTTPL